jgi:hypothetical protein
MLFGIYCSNWYCPACFRIHCVCMCVCLCDERNNKFASYLSLYPLRCLFLENLHMQSSYPVRTMGVCGKSGGIATRYLQSLHWVGVSGQRHDPAALPPPPPLRGINSVAFWSGGWMGTRAGLDMFGDEKLSSYRVSNPFLSIRWTYLRQNSLSCM